MHGEVTSRTLVWQLNYLAMRHWTYHPVSTLEQFAAAELVPRLGGAKAAGLFVEALCLAEEGSDKVLWEMASKHYHKQYPNNYPDRGCFAKSRMWEELCEWIDVGKSPTALHGFGDVL